MYVTISYYDYDTDHHLHFGDKDHVLLLLLLVDLNGLTMMKLYSTFHQLIHRLICGSHTSTKFEFLYFFFTLFTITRIKIWRCCEGKDNRVFVDFG